MNIAIVGGGAAGFFAAITCAETNPDCRVTLFERGKNVLEKVRISGGGRCNVTHACFDPRELVKFYPRGSRELLGPFLQFGPAQTIEWFEQRGVALKTESDGRMFPQTDDSQTIVDCLQRAANRAGVQMLTSARVDKIFRRPSGEWELQLPQHPAKNLSFDKIMIASGSNPAVWEMLRALGHQIVSPAPSLFTFNTKDTRLRDLAGVSVSRVKLRAIGTPWSAEGPLLVTHWGLSGPAILRVSAWGARDLLAIDYKFSLEINFLPEVNREEVLQFLQKNRQEQGRKQISAHPLFGLPARLWQRLTEAAGIATERRWADLDKKMMVALQDQLCAATFQITGKSTFKEEFVTAGGVSLKELNFKTFESRICPHLFIAGEALDIDAITGGFNFQAAWTGGWLAGKAMAGE
ncbi:MAG: NAD(P)/FAD-dependent oxidoreductase [Saprospiraceae bacterium]|nr:NAD(P)/FAD-dependent oxidoreductase [Saprospiraceae bacterium]